jgi:PAS domain S-box-containing protein
MNSKEDTAEDRIEPKIHQDSQMRVQLLVADEGNRRTIRRMLSDEFAVTTVRSIQPADLYLVEDRLLATHRSALRDRVDRDDPAFCPVVLIRRPQLGTIHDWSATADDTQPLLVDEFVEAPIDRALLVRRLRSLLVRRQQSIELLDQVSKLEAQKQALRRFERGIESTRNGIAMTDRAGTIEYVNPAFEGITGYTRDETIGENARLLLPKGAADVFAAEFWQTLTDRGEWDGEVVIERKDAQRCVVDATATAIHNDAGEIEGFVIIMSDVTERIQREQELQNRKEELDLLRQILTRYLRHNLRNDLNVILGYGQLLAETEGVPAQQSQWIEKILETTDRLMGKSDTARMYSTLLEQKGELSSYDLSEIVTDVTNTLREQYPEVTFDTETVEACPIRAREGIRQAITELIKNAAHHNDTPSAAVRVEVRNTSGGQLLIEDNGPGIPDIERASLERGDETPISHSQGIGLWLSKWVIEGVDGELSIETPDHGTRVTVDFSSPKSIGTEGIEIPALKEREQRLQTILTRMTDAIVEVDSTWTITFLDRRAEEILGMDADTIQGSDFWDVFAEIQGTELESIHRAVMESRTSASTEAYYSGIDGWIEVHVYPEFDGGLSFYFREITDTKRREQELAHERSRVELALNVTESIVWEWDFRTDQIITHPDTEAILGTGIAALDDVLASVHPHDRSRVQETLRTAIETDTPYNEEYRVRNGESTRWVEAYGEVQRDENGMPTQMIGIARDITETKEQARRYEAIFNQTYQFTGLLEPDGTLIEANDTALEFGGISREDILGKKVWNAYWFRISDETQQQTKADVQRAAKGEFVRRELEVQGADSTSIIDFSIRPITDEDDTVVLLIPEGRDITHRKERERQIKGLNHAIEDLLAAETKQEVAELGVDAARTILGLKASAIHLFDDESNGLVPVAKTLAVDELVGDLPTFVDDDSIAWRVFTEGTATAIDDLRDDPDVYNQETPVRSELHLPLGEYGILVAGSTTPSEFDDQDVVVGELLAAHIVLALDELTHDQQLREREEELRQQNERLNQFASMVSHDLRSPLSIALGYLEQYQETGAESNLETVDEALVRMQELLADLTGLARHDEPNDRDTHISLTDVSQAAWAMVTTRSASLSVIDDTVAANRSQLQALLENLFRNAVNHGGADASVRVGPLETGFYVEDSGDGILPADREKMFDHGYTTGDGGSGIGLTVVSQIAEAHNWSVTLTESTEGGARFEFRETSKIP